MSVYILVAAFIGLLYIGYGYWSESWLPFRKKPVDMEASWATKTLLEEFKALPDGHRPYTEDELRESLIALDKKYTIEVVNAHFEYYPLSGWSGWWSACQMARAKCEMPQYYELHKAIASITLAVANQKHALMMAGIQDELSRTDELTKRLREEAEIVNDVTKQLVKDK